MALIHRLDTHTINQIAAGEVIDRPASIVKELAENAIDARSTAITVEIKDGGVGLIRITDNGVGMAEEDASLSMERHATSKIVSAEDLWLISTLGFRGEALASIAAVSHMEMITKTRETEAGTRILNHGGEVIERGPTGCPDGTTVIVRNLFYNTPARKKFLKSAKQETIQVSEVMTGMILAHPEISFRYVNQGQTVYHSPGNGSLLSAICAIYGNAMRPSVIPVTGKGEGLSIDGFLGRPEVARNNRKHQVFIVNGRYVKARLLTDAVEGAFQPYQMVNRYPFCVLHVGIASDQVDVNVHPQKTELRFRQPEQVGSQIYQWLRDSLGRETMVPRPVYRENESAAGERAVHITAQSTQFTYEKPAAVEQMQLFEQTAVYGESQKISDSETIDVNPAVFGDEYEPPETDTDGIEDANTSGTEASLWNEVYTVLGTLFATYIVVECRDTVYLIDQHAAHERIMYETLRRRFLDGKGAVQEMLAPQVVELTHPEYVLLGDKMESFHALGFDLEPFGQLSVVLRGTPADLTLDNAESFLHDLLSEIAGGGTKAAIRDMIIKKACRYAVKAGDTLSALEIRHLLQEIMESDTPLTCPHGRPILVKITRRDLERMFGRTG